MAWELPKEFPDLSAAKAISVDIETYDPDLKTMGPGAKRDGYMIGLAVGTPDGFRAYYPFNHADGKQFEKANVINWAKTNLTRPNQPKVGANLLYDLEYLYEDGVEVAGPFYDVQVAEPLLDENQFKYNLDRLSMSYLGEGKDETLLEDICRDRGYKGAVQKHLWKLPPEFVGPYAEADVDRPLRVFELQRKELYRQNLADLFMMETRLIPLLLRMRQRGVKVNIPKTEEVADRYEKEIEKTHKEIELLCGARIEEWAAASIAEAFDTLNIKYPLTPKTKKPSFTRPWLERHPHPLAQLILKVRSQSKFLGTFLQGQILGLHIDGRLYTQFHQLKGDDNGTVTGRFSSSLPNLQFIPMRDPVLGPLIRGFFEPEEDCYWGRADYSQIEIRILAHYAMGVGSADLVNAYINDPRIDYHQWCADVAGIDRKKAKTINFGLIYGMGVAKLAAQLGIPFKDAERFIKMYKRKLPFLDHTLQKAMEIAQGRGYVKTILNRRRRFPYWEPRDWNLSKQEGMVKKDKELVLEMVKEIRKECEKNGEKVPRYGVRRAGTYKAFNAVDQGSAADLMKKAMVDCNEAGVFDVLGPPHLTVHDELDVSVPRTNIGREAFKEMVHIMEQAIPLKVPVLVDSDLTNNWGEAK